MQIDYGTLLSYSPIKLSIGTLKKHTLREIGDLTFEKFNFYESFLVLTPEFYYTKLGNEQGKAYWESLTDEQKSNLTMFQIVKKENVLQDIYSELFNFFFLENVIYIDGLFILSAKTFDNISDITPDDCAAIGEETFIPVLEIIQQICGIYEEEESTDNMKFKNSRAKKLYEKMLAARKREKQQRKSDINMTIPNIISAVSSMHPSLNISNIWDLTIFQLLDTFNRLRTNAIYEIESTKVSVWGDEKKTFNETLWYKNQHDKN